jgi:hypothetical protein
MTTDALKVPKTEKRVTLWVHPEGRVVGSLFLHTQSMNHAGPQEPLETLNQDDAFLVLKREQPDELRFYNRASIVRVEYPADYQPLVPDTTALPCRLQLMDGALITGTIQEPLAPDRARLYDYLNRSDERFIRIEAESDMVYLINKSYIIHATELPQA